MIQKRKHVESKSTPSPVPPSVTYGSYYLLFTIPSCLPICTCAVQGDVAGDTNSLSIRFRDSVDGRTTGLPPPVSPVLPVHVDLSSTATTVPPVSLGRCPRVPVAFPKPKVSLSVPRRSQDSGFPEVKVEFSRVQRARREWGRVHRWGPDFYRVDDTFQYTTKGFSSLDLNGVLGR